MPFEPKTVAGIVEHWARKAPRRLAIRDGEIDITYADLVRRVAALSRALTKSGLRAGDRFVHIGRNSFEQVVLLFACARLGARLVLPNWRLTAPELRELIADARPTEVVVTPEFASLSERLTADGIDGLAFACRTGRLDELFPQSNDAGRVPLLPEQSKRADLLICFTSGSSGRPKGVRITQANFLAVFEQARHWPGGRWEEGFTALCSLPFFHIAGLRAAFLALAFGGTAVISRAASASEIRTAIAQNRISKISVVPTLLKSLLEPEAEARSLLATLDTVFYGAAPIDPDLLRKARVVLACDLVQIYGATETTGAALALDNGDHALSGPRLAACGRALPGIEVKVVDADDRIAANGATGELMLKGGTIATGYWDRPKETARQFVDGWFRTGDIASIDADGFVSIHGRASSVIKTGGEKVSPEEVERVLAELESVADVAVCGIPDAHWGERVAAFVVIKPGSTFDPAALQDHCRARLASFKCPKQVEVVDHIPRNANGKISRAMLTGK